jgi:cytochrome c peroxidase
MALPIPGQLKFQRIQLKVTEPRAIAMEGTSIYVAEYSSNSLGTGKGQDAGKKFDTPTLIEVWRTSPYMHDGRVVTMEELIEIHNPESDRKPGSTLTPDEIRDLAEYVESL